MTDKIFKIKSYKLLIGIEPSDKARRVHLDCFGDEGYLFIINFTAPGKERPSSYNPEMKLGFISRAIDQMPIFIDLLRSTKPIYAYMNNVHPFKNCLMASLEPTREAQLASV